MRWLWLLQSIEFLVLVVLLLLTYLLFFQLVVCFSESQTNRGFPIYIYIYKTQIQDPTSHFKTKGSEITGSTCWSSSVKTLKPPVVCGVSADWLNVDERWSERDKAVQYSGTLLKYSTWVNACSYFAPLHINSIILKLANSMLQYRNSAVDLLTDEDSDFVLMSCLCCFGYSTRSQ